MRTSAGTYEERPAPASTMSLVPSAPASAALAAASIAALREAPLATLRLRTSAAGCSASSIVRSPTVAPPYLSVDQAPDDAQTRMQKAAQTEKRLTLPLSLRNHKRVPPRALVSHQGLGHPGRRAHGGRTALALPLGTGASCLTLGSTLKLQRRRRTRRLLVGPVWVRWTTLCCREKQQQR